MPKVSAEYVNKKKNDILEAALLVFKNKPLYEITMKDIIKAAGLSQGGIYLYFSDIDDILVSIINNSNATSDYKPNVDSIIESTTNPKDAIERLFTFLGEYIEESSATIGKMQFELGVLFTNHPERREKIVPRITEQQSGQYLMGQLISKINEGISSGFFKPTLSSRDIIIFISTSIDGIVSNVVFEKCYGLLQNNQRQFYPISLMKTLSSSVLLMLGCT